MSIGMTVKKSVDIGDFKVKTLPEAVVKRHNVRSKSYSFWSGTKKKAELKGFKRVS